MRDGMWWIPDESPGGIGDPELWIDAETLDTRGGLDPEIDLDGPAGQRGSPWIGRLLQYVTEGADAASEPGRHVEKVRQISGQDR